MTIRRADQAGQSPSALCIYHSNYHRSHMSEPAQENMSRLTAPVEVASRYKVAVYVPEADVDKVKQAGKIVHELQHHHY